MRIRTRLLIVIALTILQVLLVIGCLVWIQFRLSVALEEMHDAQALNSGASALFLLANEYSSDSAPRVRAQWEIAIASQEERMHRFVGQYEAVGLLALERKFSQAKLIAHRLFDSSARGDIPQAGILQRALLLHFIATVQETGEATRQLVEESSSRLKSVQRLGTSLVLGLMVSVGLFVVVWLSIVRRSVIKQQELTVHRNELAQELERRMVAETALQDAQRRMLAAVEEERSRIGQELHDGVGQALSAVRLLLEAQPSEQYGAEQRRKLCDYMLQTSEDLRRVVNDLRPVALDDIGLNAALRTLARQFEVSGLVVSLALPADDDLVPLALRTQVYRIVQEALNNVFRHARARRVDIQLTLTDELVLTVEDDGCGFDLEVEIEGNGLSNIRSRARTWGGEAEIESRPGKGTLISVGFQV
ncbi:sensor histidine kinase [Desulfovibrio ferrophilus]|uniref:histidine kinase n=1 Tax=Desulfovibrio ferrophilus TaxID=241368 RepID=A0A2Z6B3C7_9BACT|nr:sensor histidine kinase [Desulfovibrio ferrophilus]BBD10002.1 histidine kinase [Desulfovibrio ferrophilus]